MIGNLLKSASRVGITVIGGLAVTVGPLAAAPPPGYTLTWSEDFRQEVGATPDPSRWNYDLGGGGWGNGELETYVKDPAHAHVVADPAAEDGRALQIQATSDGQGHYTSARLTTQGKATPQYGYVEARLKLPTGQGIWPAFWMLGGDVGTAGWPACGEMDIMESLGSEPSLNHGSFHGPGYSGGSDLTATYTLPNGQQFKDGYHLFAARWRPDAVTLSVDGHEYETRTPADLPPGKVWAFNKPFFFILNLAVGGGWPGSPNASTVFPQSLRVDYIHVYTLKSTPASGSPTVSH